MLTTSPRRGWRAALDSPLLRTVVVCGSLSVLLTATPAASVVAGRDMAIASAGSGAAFPATQPGDVVDKSAPEASFVEARSVAPSESGATLTGTSESIPRDSAEADEDDDDDDDSLEYSLARVLERGIETGDLTRIDLDPSVSLESDGHSLRAPPQ